MRNNKNVWWNTGLTVLLGGLVIIGLLTGCPWNKDDDDDVIVTGSSAPALSGWTKINSFYGNANDLTADTESIYIIGSHRITETSDNLWRIEKRNKSDGALVEGFGPVINGVITENIKTGASGEFPVRLTADTDYLYIVGTDNLVGNVEWRIEKRDKITGTLVAGFGLAVDGVITSNPTSSPDYPTTIIVDGDYLYVGGGRMPPLRAENGIWKNGIRSPGRSWPGLAWSLTAW